MRTFGPSRAKPKPLAPGTEGSNPAPSSGESVANRVGLLPAGGWAVSPWLAPLPQTPMPVGRPPCPATPVPFAPPPVPTTPGELPVPTPTTPIELPAPPCPYTPTASFGAASAGSGVGLNPSPHTPYPAPCPPTPRTPIGKAVPAGNDCNGCALPPVPTPATPAISPESSIPYSAICICSFPGQPCVGSVDDRRLWGGSAWGG